MAKETKASCDLLAEARANYKIAEEWWDHNRKAWLADAKFRAGDQWPADIKKKREDKGNPCLVVDKINQYVRQVVNDGRQNRPAVKVRPVDSGADIEVADGLQGLVRSICNRSNADEAFDTALDHAAGNGFGYIRVLTDYIHGKTFDQELCVRRVPNPLAVLLGPHEMADGSDAEFGFVVTEEPKKRYEKKYPKAQKTDWTDSAYTEGWSTDTNVRVCEYFYKTDEPGTIHLLEDGTTVTDEEYQAAQKGGQQSPIVQSRVVPVCKVKWCRLSGAEILEENDWLGKWIPIIPVYGNESNIEGKVTYSGMVRAAKDPQMLHNFARSAFASRAALTPKAPWLAGAEQIADFPEWNTANTGNHEVLRYKMYDEAQNQLPPPQRIQPADIPSGFAQDMQISEHDIQAALGMYAASVGQPSNEKSGRAIMARQREGDTSTFHYMDNLNRAIRHLGRILVDLAPKIYDSTRIVRLLGEDGSTREAQIDPRQKQAHTKGQVNGKAISIFNLNVGIYDVDIGTGPSYTTKRAESAEAMIQLTQANPTMWQTHGDLIVEAQDWPNAQAFAKRSKLFLPPQVQQAEQEDATNPEADAIRQQAQQMLQQASQQMDQAKQIIGQLQAENVDLKKQYEIKEADVAVKGYAAETDRITALSPALTPESITQIVQQTVAAIMAQPVPTESPPEPPDPEDMGGMMMPQQMPQQQPPSGGFSLPGA